MNGIYKESFAYLQLQVLENVRNGKCKELIECSISGDENTYGTANELIKYLLIIHLFI